MKSLFKAHIEKRVSEVHQILEKNKFDHLYIESGFPDYYFKDDQPTFFKTNPYFNFFCPDSGQGHILKFSKSSNKPVLFYFIPDDFWHETSKLNGDFWEDFFDIKVTHSYDTSWKEAEEKGSENLLISPNPKAGLRHSCKTAPSAIFSNLDWIRSEKTGYEVECIKKANESAALGHKKAKTSFFEGASESQIFMDYLLASGQRESEIPYNSIVAFDRNAAILHYQAPKNNGEGATFLIDAGARFNGYCSDITRTYYKEEVHPLFKDVHRLLEAQQKKFCEMVRPGVDYVEVHRAAYNGVAEILVETGLFKGSHNEAIEKKIPYYFFPHGIGHPIGLQVHDVGAKQLNADGAPVEQPKDFPFLRTLRTIQENDVLTIEPGFYIIPMLLENLKSDNSVKTLMNWSAIDQLAPFGGIRIEDEVLAEKNASVNLTRPFLP